MCAAPLRAGRRSLHTAEDAADTKWVTQQWVARGLAGSAVDPIQAALAGALPLGGAAPAAAQPAAVRPRAAQPEGPSAAEALLASKKKGKKGGAKKGGGGGKGFGG